MCVYNGTKIEMREMELTLNYFLHVAKWAFLPQKSDEGYTYGKRAGSRTSFANASKNYAEQPSLLQLLNKIWRSVHNKYRAIYIFFSCQTLRHKLTGMAGQYGNLLLKNCPDKFQFSMFSHYCLGTFVQVKLSLELVKCKHSQKIYLIYAVVSPMWEIV